MFRNKTIKGKRSTKTHRFISTVKKRKEREGTRIREKENTTESKRNYSSSEMVRNKEHSQQIVGKKQPFARLTLETEKKLKEIDRTFQKVKVFLFGV